jgi:hypothetical protein
MSNGGRPTLEWAIRGLLAALVLTNLWWLVLLRTGGPLLGLAIYLVLLALTFGAGRRDDRPVMVGGLVGLAVHVAEVVRMGWSAFPVLMALNLVLPAGLILVAWLANQQPEQEGSRK